MCLYMSHMVFLMMFNSVSTRVLEINHCLIYIIYMWWSTYIFLPYGKQHTSEYNVYIVQQHPGCQHSHNKRLQIFLWVIHPGYNLGLYIEKIAACPRISIQFMFWTYVMNSVTDWICFLNSKNKLNRHTGIYRHIFDHLSKSPRPLVSKSYILFLHHYLHLFVPCGVKGILNAMHSSEAL